MFLGRMTKHHLVQMDPVARRAAFCVRESFSAGRRKSEAPARTTPHFITGALITPYMLADVANSRTRVARSKFHQVNRPYQKCTVLIPTSLVHNLWNKLCCCAGAPSTAGFAAVPCHLLKACLKCEDVRDANDCRAVCCAKRRPNWADIITNCCAERE